jgi:MarR family transcriptional regulator, lower aerobic nicotinate degradation pathway regulator
MRKTSETTSARLLDAELYSRPSFLLRQCHQIATTLLLEEMTDHDVTPAQLSVMTLLRRTPGMDQKTLSQRLGLDVATVSEIAARLERRGIIDRLPAKADRRSKLLFLTTKGQELLSVVQPLARRASSKLVSALAKADEKRLIALLQQLIEEHLAEKT